MRDSARKMKMKLRTGAIYLLVTAISCAIAGPTKKISSTGSPPSNVKDDMKNVIAMIPKERFFELANKHLKYDVGFQAAIKYFNSLEWQRISDIIRKNPDWQKFKQFLTNLGIDINKYLKCLEAFLEQAEVPQDVPEDAQRDLKPFLADLEESLPVAKILAKINERIMNNPQFHVMYDELSSPESRALVENVRAIPEFVQMIASLNDMGIQVDDIISAFYVFLGWE
ncbi:uncharacterized protein LOC109595132 [Aethina tumida]|uniref:uncharacterized protein LOC109595132 n=1 Tax=Aethina tumida TaxID=116153 RepID=UPI002147AB43|nr:uncharacterized protein LOC109595132 [Aethina tumida]